MVRGFLVSLIVLFAWSSSSLALRVSSRGFVAEREGLSSADCEQPAAEQEAIIREADTRRFTIRRIELIGNVSTADDLLHRRIATRMEEGNLFSRRNLMASLRSVSRLKTIYPVTMRDVVARLDQSEKTLDLRICINERPRSVRRAS